MTHDCGQTSLRVSCRLNVAIMCHTRRREFVCATSCISRCGELMETTVWNAVMSALAGSCIALAGIASAEEFPTRPLRIIVPFAPGGASDVVGRILAQKLGESMGQTVVVDNRAGAGANIGIGLAARSAPDGYTLLIASSAFAVNPSLYAKAPYDPYKDFQPLTC